MLSLYIHGDSPLHHARAGLKTGLFAVWVQQTGWPLAGSNTSAWVALAVGAVLLLQTVMLRLRRRRLVG